MKMSKTSWICLALIIVCAIGLLAINSYVLNMTHDCYNVIDVMLL
jgi:hypothetical protein